MNDQFSRLSYVSCFFFPGDMYVSCLEIQLGSVDLGREGGGDVGPAVCSSETQGRRRGQAGSNRI